MNKKNIRPNIMSAKVNDKMSDVEQFQNSVLRPILKMQHPIIVAFFNHHLNKTNFNLKSLIIHQKALYIKTAIGKNQSLKNQYIGMVTGMFTDDEFTHYLTNFTEYNRRILQMIVQRLQDTYQ